MNHCINCETQRAHICIKANMCIKEIPNDENTCEKCGCDLVQDKCPYCSSLPENKKLIDWDKIQKEYENRYFRINVRNDIFEWIKEKVENEINK